MAETGQIDIISTQNLKPEIPTSEHTPLQVELALVCPIRGAGRPLFEVRSCGASYAYDVTADGQRFLVKMLMEQKTSAPITLVLNWTAEVKK